MNRKSSLLALLLLGGLVAQGETNANQLPYEDALDFKGGLAAAKSPSDNAFEGRRWGFVDAKGSWKIKPAWDALGSFDGDTAFAMAPGGFWGMIDRKGQWVQKPQFEKFAVTSEGLTAVLRDKKWGFVNSAGRIVVKPQYDEVGVFSNGYVRVLQDGKWGFLDVTGEYVIPPNLEAAWDLKEGWAPIKRGDLYGWIDTNGFQIAAQYEDVGDFCEGLALFKLTPRGAGSDKSRWGYVNKKGSVQLPALYEEAGNFVQGLAKVSIDKKWTFIDRKGGKIGALSFDAVGDFSGPLARVQTAKKWGYVNRKGELVVQAIYDEAEDFRNQRGRVAVLSKAFLRQQLRWGLVDGEGKVVVPPTHDELVASGFGYRFKKDGLQGFMNRDGEILVPASWEELGEPSEGLVRVKSKGRAGFLPIRMPKPPTPVVKPTGNGASSPIEIRKP